ncbi:MAG: hypothetical protein ITG07_17550 [Candidimonas sp.]|nr:hypothetical protein [Candidimonas sp.]
MVDAEAADALAPGRLHAVIFGDSPGLSGVVHESAVLQKARSPEFMNSIAVVRMGCKAAMPVLALACSLPGPTANADAPRFENLSPVQVYAAPQISVSPPTPLPDPVAPEAMFLEPLGLPDTGRDIDSYLWRPGDGRQWRRGKVADTSPGLRGARGWRRSPRLKSPVSAGSSLPWQFGTSNWRYAGEDGWSLTLGAEEIAVPTWSNAARLGGVSISQSSLSNANALGSWEYAMSVGVLDATSGQDQGDLDYGPTASNTVLRYGISPEFTLESQLELASDLVTSGLGGEYEGEWGVWSAGVARASYGLYKGWRYQTGYTVNVLDDLQLSWKNERHTAGFTDLSRYQDGGIAPGGIRQQWSATVPLGRWGDVSGVYETERSALGSKKHSFGFGQQFWYSPNLRVGLRAEREFVTGDYDIGIHFSVPIF